MSFTSRVMDLSRYLLVVSVLFISITNATNISKVEKRELNWIEMDNTIKNDENTNLDMRVDYLRPHQLNAVVNTNENYMAFTLYKRNGNTATSDGHTGIFHFVNSDIVFNLIQNGDLDGCPRRTMHAGAYYYFYRECPEDTSGVVASGYCYQGENGRGLVYNSYTFNVPEFSYLDTHYYLPNSGSRAVDLYEQKVIQTCFNNWKNQQFSKTWACSLSSIPAGRRRRTAVDARVKRDAYPCGDCDCIFSSSSHIRHEWTITMSSTILIVLALYQVTNN